MKILFCADPLNPRLPDPMYAPEVEVVRSLDIAHERIDFEALTNEGDAERAVRMVTPSETPTLAIYRGWMLKPARYAELYAALETHGILLVNSPTAYRHCHYLPESYSVIEGKTPKTVWMPLTDTPDFDAITNYWEYSDYVGSIAPIEKFLPVIQRVNSRFFTMDIARKSDGGALIVELGDAQVAGLPGALNTLEFYRRLVETFQPPCLP